ncbi:MAG: L-seryl-tRNA(Sec) selenium transferase [Eubacteriales bacterium]|nr:L-seryl-tRNA(Sec) selenium transferase [Eubacteriales bacterium]
MDNQLLRNIPKVDELLRTLEQNGCCADAPLQTVTEAVRAALEELRAALKDGSLQELPDQDALCARIAALVRQARLPSLRGVINATGVVLHTNLGRACLSDRAVAAVEDAARSYSTLEYDVINGCRGTRYSHVETLLTRLTGAESALVVNNNAAAVLLILSAMAQGGEVVVSRGELVEIGGSFRIPEIMESCGCRLHEVGATNKTHLHDYESGVNENTRALLKVHTSNYKIMGFTEAVELDALVALGREKGLPVIQDLGSGLLLDLRPVGIQGEPTVRESVSAGVDVVSFSGDKLLGGPQAGVIVGKKCYIDLLKKHPLHRAMRVDKMTLSALEVTLRSYLEGTAFDEIPTLRMLAAQALTLKERAERLQAMLLESGIASAVIPEQDQVGGGAAPTQLLPTYAVALRPKKGSVDGLERAMRLRERPIIGRIARDAYLLDVRTLREDELAAVKQALEESGLV